MGFFLFFMVFWLGIPYMGIAVTVLDIAWPHYMVDMWWLCRLGIVIGTLLWFFLGCWIVGKFMDGDFG